MLSKSVECLPSYSDFNRMEETDSAVRERRRRTRIKVHWPICFFRQGTAEFVETVTHNLSSDGFYCLARAPFVPGEIRECTLGVPIFHPNGGDQLRPVLCRVRVIRVETLRDDGSYGVGCQIEDYRFLSPATDKGSSLALNGHTRAIL